MLKRIIDSVAKTAYKQVILVREDLRLPKGKIGAQCAHASVEAVLRAPSSDVKAWRKEGMKKVVLKVEDERELYRYIQQAKDLGMTTALITDAGRTVVEPGTTTVGSIGPNKEKDIDKITEKLSLL
ncbi:aminoacyl-tRNA hydrolase [Candidatus Woesearchaeota archaeon]|nr:aminoacyl-tRNA hydrolase [Candidatus Woesearchaeota archaeon]